MNVLGNHYLDIFNVKTDQLIEDEVVRTDAQPGDFTLKETYNSLRVHAPKKK